jgi:FkbM family methyltransferase
MTVLKKISKFNPEIVIDGGANLGLYSLITNQIIPDCKIYAFEPVGSTYDKMVKNINEHNKIIPVMKGLFKENCSHEINIFHSDDHSSLYDVQGASYELNHKQTIELVRGDDFIKENDIEFIDVLKLDIEGAEYDALLGFENSIRNGKIKLIQFEYGYINITTKKLLIDYYNFFEEKGYAIGKIFPKKVEFRKYSFIHEDFIGPNFVAVKKTETELIASLSKK